MSGILWLCFSLSVRRPWPLRCSGCAPPGSCSVRLLRPRLLSWRATSRVWGSEPLARGTCGGGPVRLYGLLELGAGLGALWALASSGPRQ